MTLRISRLASFRHLLIKLRVKKWLFPLLFVTLSIIIGLAVLRRTILIAQIMLAPLLMTLTFIA